MLSLLVHITSKCILVPVIFKNFFFNFYIFLFFLVHFLFIILILFSTCINLYFTIMFPSNIHHCLYMSRMFTHSGLSNSRYCRTDCHQVMPRDRSGASACTLIGLMTLEFTLYVMRKT